MNNQLFELDPYCLNKQEKSKMLDEELGKLTEFHYNHCPEYKKILDSLNFDVTKSHSYAELPFIPVRLFKFYDLLSCPKEEIVKTMTSSGTSGQAVSKIYLSAQNTKNQSKTLTEIITSFIGKQRLPLLLLDTGVRLRGLLRLGLVGGLLLDVLAGFGTGPWSAHRGCVLP